MHVCEFASDPGNLPLWADRPVSSDVRPDGDDWIAGTQPGTMRLSLLRGITGFYATYLDCQLLMVAVGT